MQVSFTVKLERMKTGFIDSTKKRAARSAQDCLMHMAGWIAKTASRSIRTVPKRFNKNKSIMGEDGEIYSKPGNPPYSRHPDKHMKKIRYFWDKNAAVVGPQKLNMRGNVPAALEHGGACTTTKLIWVGPYGQKRRKFILRTFHMRPRPYMRPALDKALAKKEMFFSRMLDRKSFTITYQSAAA